MIENEQTIDESCSACPISECRDRRKGAVEGGLMGWRFVLTSIAVFLLPIILAVIGAAYVGGSDNSRSLAGTIGLLGGMTLTALCFKIFSRNQKSLDRRDKEDHS